jgi:outer membrane beta-barrel protein
VLLLRLLKNSLLPLVVTVGVAVTFAVFASSRVYAYDRATEDRDNVKNKLYAKNKKLQLEGRAGFILNQSYMNTLLANAQISYFFSEEWGFSIEGSMAMNSDKNERGCIETFYNDPHQAVGPECGDEAALEEGRAQEQDPKQANFGPAYVPVRELKYIFDVNALWNPIYGKQIVLMSGTNYFDFYMSMGAGIAMSDYYPKSTTLQNGKEARGSFDEKESDPNKLPGTLDPSLTGKEGRPTVESQTNPLIHLSIGQRFHFFKRFMITAELKNYTLLGTESGFDNFVTLMGGVGMRF